MHGLPRWIVVSDTERTVTIVMNLAAGQAGGKKPVTSRKPAVATTFRTGFSSPDLFS
jgi:hypothetical protein